MKKIVKLTTLALTTAVAVSTVSPVFATYTKIDALNSTTNGHIKVNTPETPLQLKAVPDLEFGKVKVGSTGNKVTTTTNNVETLDLRGVQSGWKVQVKYGDDAGNGITSDEAWKSAEEQGRGIELSLAAQTFADENDGKNVGNKPTGVAVKAVNEVDQTVSSAAANESAGMGDFIGNIGQDGTTLTIPANNYIGDYTANLVWTLSDSPA